MQTEEGMLTERERDVLRLLADGHTNREVAAQLYISTRTAEFHRANIQRKLRAKSRSELMRRACEHGLAVRAALNSPRPGEGT
jgi:DNA-binding NarL/FixJ family response regulator